MSDCSSSRPIGRRWQPIWRSAWTASTRSDEEQLVERLRHFQRAAIFRLAVADLLAALPVMQVSDRLTDVAELIIERALQLTWQQLTPKLGVPMCGEGAARRAVRLCVIGYGKLGGMELGYGSDLDLVFLHDSSGARQETERRAQHRQPGVLPALRAAAGASADGAFGAPGACTRSICGCVRAARPGC